MRQLRHRVAARFALSEITVAHEALEAGQVLGNVEVEA